MPVADCKNAFALIAKPMSEREEKLYAFSIDDDSICKDRFLTLLSKTVCDNLCRADYVSCPCYHSANYMWYRHTLCYCST